MTAKVSWLRGRDRDRDWDRDRDRDRDRGIAVGDGQAGDLAHRSGSGLGLQRLIAALDHTNPDVRAGAARELGAFGSDPDAAEEVVDALVAVLVDVDASVCSSAALSLGECGAAAAGAIPALIRALAQADDDVRSSAGIALQDIGDVARGPLEQALSHPDARVRDEAEAVLAGMVAESADQT